MVRFKLHVPAWHHVEKGDMAATVYTVWLDHLPRENEQIEVPGGGVVEVANVRHRPLWTDQVQANTLRPGGHVEHHEDPPEVFTCWANRPEGAPVYRTPPHKLRAGPR